MQLSGGTFPTGSFNHSYGLETYIQNYRINTATEVESILQTILEANIRLDAVFVKEAYEATLQDDSARLAELQQLYTAAKPAKELFEASMKTGRSLLLGVKNLQAGNETSFYENLLNNSLQYHYAIGYGVVAAKLSLPLRETVQTYLFSGMVSLVSVATRIMPLGQNESQLVLYRLGKQLENYPIIEEEFTIENVNSFFPGLEIASMEHETLYTRVCMS
ncbi:urease accessory protein UreF [Peribacillus huizhouensis]|uniref:Urease accessory protein UreF n=1 Tax=Peribacillus huizhouensis TaxID=1501239 RepID=A0ABR6CKX8_9BACI|nr:urease accessory UreF family protein [Peribacillus huizhouensis]MBA9025569.1 urease accessory protein [Peribacillus huizhouensis]